MSIESAPDNTATPTLYRIKTNAAEIVVHINAQGMQNLQTNCPTPLVPAKLGGELCLGKARPFDLGSNNDTLRWNMGPALAFQPPPDGWSQRSLRTNTICSALAGLSEEDTEYKFFPMRNDAIDQFAEWAAASELKILHRNSTYRAHLGSYVDLDEINQDPEVEDDKGELKDLVNLLVKPDVWQ
ncbi:hypothetical protein C8J56DRAFT_883261 [Mycena floridula]|nr:hypothetical protein C8J56DRAFT_883261 [Mycena floridula]